MSRVFLGVRLRLQNSPRLELNYVLTSEEFAALQRDFPNLYLHTNNSASHPHAFAAAARLCQAKEFYKRIPRTQARDLYGEPHVVVEIGAIVLSHASSPHAGVHLCSPIFDLHDSQRAKAQDLRARELIAAGELNKDVWSQFTGGGRKGGSTAQRCYKRAERCTRKATYGFSLHANYDVDPRGFGEMLDEHDFHQFVAYINFVPGVLLHDKRVVPVLNMTWMRDGKDIRFVFSGDNSLGYTHNYETYVHLLTRNHLVTPSGRYYVIEKPAMYTGAVKLVITRCDRKPESLTSTLTSSY